MNKNNLLKILLLICAALLIVSVTLRLRQVVGRTGYQYNDAEQFTAGEAEITRPVKNLEIDWLNGAVHIAYHGKDSVKLSESSDKPIASDLQMRWRLDGDTLRIRFAKAGLRVSNPQQKELTVTLPEGLVLRDADISATSGTLDIPALEADSLRLDVTSGDIAAKAKARTVFVDATSGNVGLRLSERAETISASCTSGGLSVEAPGADRVRLGTSSGSVLAVLGQTGELDLSTTSGNVRVRAESLKKGGIDSTSGDIDAQLGAFGSLKLSSTSGKLQLSLPEKPGFTASVETASGRFEHSLPLSRQGNDYVCGDGSGRLILETTSGDIRLSPLA